MRSLVCVYYGSCKCEEWACLLPPTPLPWCGSHTKGVPASPCLELRPSGLILAPYLAVCLQVSCYGSGTPSFSVLGPSRFALGIEMHVWELAGGNSPLSPAPCISEVPPHLCHSRLPEPKPICLHLIFCETDAIVLIQVLNLKLLPLLENSKAYISQ